MRYAFAEFDRDGDMLPALYCRDCARRIAQAVGGCWDAVILAESDDFTCNSCFSTEAPECDIMVSRDHIERDLRDLRS